MTESLTFPGSLTIHFTNNRFSTLCGQAILTDTPVVFRHLPSSGFDPTYLCDACDERHKCHPSRLEMTGRVVYRYEDYDNILLEYDEA